jgi:hypothetical protein
LTYHVQKQKNKGPKPNQIGAPPQPKIHLLQQEKEIEFNIKRLQQGDIHLQKAGNRAVIFCGAWVIGGERERMRIISVQLQNWNEGNACVHKLDGVAEWMCVRRNAQFQRLHARSQST